MEKMKKILIIILAIFPALYSCNSGNGGRITIEGAGATFPYPFYSQIFSNYQKETGIRVEYGAIGSGGGIRSLKDRVVDFGGTDAYLTDERIAGELPADIVHIPTSVGAVVLGYKLPGVMELRLTPELLAGIFLGEITMWNDPLLVAENPQTNLPAIKITVVHRSDGSGTTSIFSDYLSKVSEKWEREVGRGTSLSWPTGIGGQGNPGVTGMLSQTTGGIGYIGYEYASSQMIYMASLKNSSGNYVRPTIRSITAAARGDIPDDTRIMLTDPADEDAWPVCGFTWLIIYREQAYGNRTLTQARETVNLLRWIIGDQAQAVAPRVNYAPLSADAVVKARRILETVTFNGEKILNGNQASNISMD
jgi:phosphate transport system substrate-binding protein